MHQLPECDSYTHASFGGINIFWWLESIPNPPKDIRTKFHSNRSIRSKVGHFAPPRGEGGGGGNNFWWWESIPNPLKDICAKFHQNRSISSKTPPGGATDPPRGGWGGKFKKMKKRYGDIDGENSFIKFELNPITIKGSKLGGKFFGLGKSRNPQFAFWTLRKKFRQNGQNEGRF